MKTLFLIPNTLGETAISGVIPSEVVVQIKKLTIFASENPKNTRRFLKKIDRTIDIDSLAFIELNEHSSAKDIESCLAHLAHHDIGIISEAGCPGIADPGAELVALAHRHNYRVVPLVGLFHPVGADFLRFQRANLLFQRLPARKIQRTRPRLEKL